MRAQHSLTCAGHLYGEGCVYMVVPLKIAPSLNLNRSALEHREVQRTKGKHTFWRLPVSLSVLWSVVSLFSSHFSLSLTLDFSRDTRAAPDVQHNHPGEQLSERPSSNHVSTHTILVHRKPEQLSGMALMVYWVVVRWRCGLVWLNGWRVVGWLVAYSVHHSIV